MCQKGQEEVASAAMQASSDIVAYGNKYCRLSCSMTWHEVKAVEGLDIPGKYRHSLDTHACFSKLL